MCFNRSLPIGTGLRSFEPLWNGLNSLKPVWAGLNQFEKVASDLSRFQLVITGVIRFDVVWPGRSLFELVRRWSELVYAGLTHWNWSELVLAELNGWEPICNSLNQLTSRNLSEIVCTSPKRFESVVTKLKRM